MTRCSELVMRPRFQRRLPGETLADRSGLPGRFVIRETMPNAGMREIVPNFPTRFPSPQRLSIEARTVFEVAVWVLVPSGSRRQVERLFGGRWSHYTVRDWRVGRSRPPRAAIAIVVQRLKEHAWRYNDLAEQVGRLEPAAGQGSHGNIRKWNARRHGG
jgi:hypothetical protein